MRRTPIKNYMNRLFLPKWKNCLMGKCSLSLIKYRFNVTIFAYGQTGAGKTHTIFGQENDGLIFLILD